MIKGLYTAGSGMMLNMAKQDAIAINLANVNSNGFKKDVTVSKAFPEMLMTRLGENKKEGFGIYTPEPMEQIGGLGTGATLDGVYTDFSVGNLKNTEQTTDFALGEEGFFVVETPQGECFTRAGAFKINYEGLLTDNNGYPVLDIYDQYIYLDSDDITVDKRGIITSNDEELTQFKIVAFADNNVLEKIGDNLFRTDSEYYEVENPEVIQGFIEESNVNAVKEMVNLITVVRNYEALQKVVQAEEETLQVAIDRVASTV
ncbi:MAG: flagellar hook-basal body protein [Syntrophomonadaceae bacterium]|nr:flagellar hook-basal body protein [Syntrophomonadaceae bacterium]